MVDLDAEYDNRARVPEHPAIIAGWAADAAAWRAARPEAQIGVVYGQRPRALYDLFPAADDAPLVVFIHGGYWQALDPSYFSHLARGLNARGVAVAIPGYTLCPQATVGWIIEEMRTACLALHRRFGRRLVVAGHSAGGHLAAALLATDFAAIDAAAPGDLVASAYAISGLFDLEPLLHTRVNDKLRLDAEAARAASPIHMPPPAGRRLDAVVGGAESGEYLRQSRAIVDAWGSAGVATRYEAIPGANHFTVIAPLADPDSAMTARLAALADASR